MKLTRNISFRLSATAGLVVLLVACGVSQKGEQVPGTKTVIPSQSPYFQPIKNKTLSTEEPKVPDLVSKLANTYNLEIQSQGEKYLLVTPIQGSEGQANIYPDSHKGVKVFEITKIGDNWQIIIEVLNAQGDNEKVIVPEKAISGIKDVETGKMLIKAEYSSEVKGKSKGFIFQSNSWKEISKTGLERLQELVRKQNLVGVKYGVREVNEDGEIKRIDYVYEDLDQDQDKRIYFVEERNGEQILRPSPDITGMVREISEDGLGVSYLNPEDGQVIFTATVSFPGEMYVNMPLYQMAEDLTYDPSQAGIPKNAYEIGLVTYKFEGVNADFYGINNLDLERAISLQKSFLKILGDEYLKPFWKFIADSQRKPRQSNVYFVTRKETGMLARYGYGYTAIFPLFFNDKMVSDQVIAGSGILLHEKVAHSNETTKDYGGVVSEVGNRKIPPDFDKWTPDQLLEALAKGEIGAYHLDLWGAYYWKQPISEVYMWINTIKNRKNLLRP